MTSRRDINSSEFSHVLPFAARNGWHEVVSALLEMKANPNSQDSDGRTAASHCAELGRQELLQRLIAKGADLDLADKRDMTPLDYTAKNGRKDVLKLLMKIDSLDLNRKMYNGRSALWLAIDQHHVKVMKELLDNGANVNEKDDHGFWPLQMAVKRGHEDAVELLLSQRSIIAWRNAARDSLLWASWRGYADIMRLLLKKGSESGSSDAFGPDRIREEVEDLLKMHADNAKYIPPLRNHSDGFFSTTDIRPPSLPTVKDMQHIQFDPPHSSTPQLMIGISALNMKSDSHIDTHWEANSVLQTGFSLVRKRYQEAEMFGKPVRSASAVWLEFGAEDKNFQVGQFPVSQHSSSIIRIPFQDKFDKAPHIVVWLNGLYLPNIGKIGWHINAKYVYATGSDFHFTIEPADEGSENQLSVSWLAYPSESTDVKSGSDFIDTRPLLGLAQEKRVDFVTRLRRTPRVFLALSGFAMQSSQEVDIEVKVNR
ncbi:hypothetical protein TrVGV298_003872 [Trichoderma virens]|nr:hypothetical protein TrVGV298_003872 [Trichoderma virens]